MNVSCKYISFFCFLLLGACSSTVLRKKSSAVVNEKVVIDRPVVHSLDQAPSYLKKLKNSVVRLKIHQKKDELTQEFTKEYIATGFFYKTSDLLVTSLHTFPSEHPCLSQQKCTVTIGLIKDAKTLSEKQVTATVALVETEKDLIYLKIPQIKEFMEISPLLPSEKAHTSKETLAVGGFFEDKPAITFTSGKKLNHNKTKNLTSLIVSSGFSGSPLIDEDGKLVGVISGFMPIKNHHIGLAQYVSVESNESNFSSNKANTMVDTASNFAP